LKSGRYPDRAASLSELSAGRRNAAADPDSFLVVVPSTGAPPESL
jgi:hypothetical protein